MNADKNESKAKTNTNLNSTLRVIFSLTHAVLLVFCIIFIYVSFGEVTSFWVLFGVLTGVSFVLGLFFNALTQYMGCSKINFPQVALNSLFSPGLVAFFLTLLRIVPDIETPVRSVLPVTLTPIYQKAISQGFYMFWAALYGQVFASGFVQVC